jgi:D-alanyl-D-alanine carboxypeptidase
MMNEYAKRLGMSGSNFGEQRRAPALAQPLHITARDVATLCGRPDPEFPQYSPALQPQRVHVEQHPPGNATAC